VAEYRNALPQLAGGTFFSDGGIETDLIFNHGIEIPEFAAHTLLPVAETRQAMTEYFRRYLSLARDLGVGYILDAPTWKAHMHWAPDLGADEDGLRAANLDSVAFIAGLREEFAGNSQPIVLNAFIGPQGCAYAPETEVAAHQAEDYHAQQVGWLARTEADMVTAMTFTQSSEAIGVVRAAQAAGLPAVVSFTVETDGALPNGEPLGEAIDAVDAATDGAAAYFMVNCAHPEHFAHVFDSQAWTRRIRGMRCNASRMSHAELDACEVLDDGDPVELGDQYRKLVERMPWLNVFGGCCGSDLRHITAIAIALAA
jgi:homocysteine S-methyltransferase